MLRRQCFMAFLFAPRFYDYWRISSAREWHLAAFRARRQPAPCIREMLRATSVEHIMQNRRTDGKWVNLFDMRLTYTLLLQYDKLNTHNSHRHRHKCAPFLSSFDCHTHACARARIVSSWSSFCDPFDGNERSRWQFGNLFTITLTTEKRNANRWSLVCGSCTHTRARARQTGNDRKFARYLFLIKVVQILWPPSPSAIPRFIRIIRLVPVKRNVSVIRQTDDENTRDHCSIRFHFLFIRRSFASALVILFWTRLRCCSVRVNFSDLVFERIISKLI